MEDHKQAIATHYDKHWRLWHDVYEGKYDTVDTSFEVLHRRDIILSFLDAYAGGKTLKTIDIGCGAGVLMRDVLDRGHHVVGIDVSANMVRAAEKNTSKRFPHTSTCMVGDINSLPFPDESFDGAICAGVLSHQPSDHDAVAEVSRIIKNDGIVLATLPNLVKLQNLLDVYYYFVLFSRLARRIFASSGRSTPGVREFVRGDAFTVRKYSYFQLRDLGKGTGLTPQETVSCGFGPFTFWKKEILSPARSLAISNFLEKLSSRRPFGFLKVFANSWVIRLEKSSGD